MLVFAPVRVRPTEGHGVSYLASQVAVKGLPRSQDLEMSKVKITYRSSVLEKLDLLDY